MYGTIFSYLGYMAHAGYNNGCCVPQFIFDTLHNPSEKNPRKRLAKLSMKNVIDDLGMVREDEGCCIAQIANLCKKEKLHITHWISSISCLKPIKILHQETIYQD